MITSPTLQKAIKAHEDFVAAHPEQFRLSLALFRLLAEGKPVSPEGLATSLQRSLQEVQALLHSADIRVDQAGNIIGHGLSLVPTPHQFHLSEQALYTWCALDSLAFPALLGRAARLTVAPETIVDLEPASAVVSIHLPGEDTDICNDGHFFVSHDLASTWPSLHPRAVLLSVEEAAELGRGLASVIRSIAGEQKPQRHS